MGVSDHRHYDRYLIDNIENKTENLRLQECSVKNRSFRKLVISLEISFFNVNTFLMSIFKFISILKYQTPSHIFFKDW